MEDNKCAKCGQYSGGATLCNSCQKKALNDSKPNPTKPRKVLLVDDSEEMREMFQRILLKAGFEVVSCENANNALAQNLNEFFAVMTDNDMPGMSGVEFIEALRGLGIWIPIVMVSGSADPRVSEKVESLKAKFFKKFSAKDAVDSLSKQSA